MIGENKIYSKNLGLWLEIQTQDLTIKKQEKNCSYRSNKINKYWKQFNMHKRLAVASITVITWGTVHNWWLTEHKYRMTIDSSFSVTYLHCSFLLTVISIVIVLGMGRHRQFVLRLYWRQGDGGNGQLVLWLYWESGHRQFPNQKDYQWRLTAVWWILNFHEILYKCNSNDGLCGTEKW